MPRTSTIIAALLCLPCLVTAVSGRAGAAIGRSPEPSFAKLEPSLGRDVMAAPTVPVVAWVYFTDRAGAEQDPAAFTRPVVSVRSLERRRARGAIRGLIASDLPVHEAYVRALTLRGARVRGVSRWLNAASVEMPGRLAAELARLPFVAHLERVAVGMPIRTVGEPELAEMPGDTDATHAGRGATPASAHPGAATLFAPGDTAYYGGSFRQLSMMQVPQLHKAGYTGAGVLVCMLDEGFRLTHQVFANLHVLATRDFIHRDSTVDDPDGQGGHGTLTLACVAGSKPGTYSGGAFGATVALGKTEVDATEQPVEMDYWQFGTEWADSLGADVISSSLGYSTFDSPFPSYTYADMNGRTTVVARAAVEAARRGITVVNAAGNEGANSWKKIISPGDADSIVTVGAVDSFNVVTAFSSRGPTSDGRIKPDVTAMGASVLLPSFSDSTGTKYVRGSGTSFATPLTAGVAALLLEAHPNWGPFEVREALRMTALNHAAPDTIIGWGLVQGLAASAWIPSVGVPAVGGVARLQLAAGPNPLHRGGDLAIRYAAPAGERVTLDVLDLAGRRQSALHAGAASGTAHWAGRDAAGRALPAGIYWVRLATAGGPSRAIRIALIP